MSEEINAQVLNSVLKLLLQALTGSNAFNVPHHAFTADKSFQHIIGAYQRSQDFYNFQYPITNAVHDLVGNRIYGSTMRLLGYSAKESEQLKQGAGAKFLQGALSFGSSLYMGQAVNAFASTAHKRLYSNRSANIEASRDSFTAAGRGIIESISDGSLQGYSVDDAFRVATLFTRQGRYDFTANNQRASKIKRDLQDYAEGLNNLRDGLQGSLTQVLDSFEKLTGSSATVMQKDRFTALTRSLYGATTFGGVTPQLLQSAIATQHAYLQGTGATQATSMALGTINANILANGVSVEGASQNVMNEALTRQNARWITTGKAKELTAAFGWWADTHGKTRNAETFEEFRRSLGSIDDVTVRRYLERNNVSGTYINSARNRRNMAAPYIYNAFHEKNLENYQQAFNRYSSTIGGLSTEDMWLSDDELSDKLMRDARAKSKDGMLSRQQIDRITGIVEGRRNIIRGITQTTDADNGLNILRNQRQAVEQQRVVKANSLIANMVGEDRSIAGISGVLNKLIKQQGATDDTIAGVIKSFLGVDVNVKDIKNVEGIDATKLRTAVGAALGTSDEKLINNVFDFSLKNVNKLSNAERDILFNTSKDARLGKDEKDKTTWGTVRKDLLQKRSIIGTKTGVDQEKSKKEYIEALTKARDKGFISEEEAFIATYGVERNIDFSTGPEVMKTAENIFSTYKKAKGMGLKETDAKKFASTLERIRKGTAKTEDKDFIKGKIGESTQLDELRAAKEKAAKAVSVDNSEERRKAFEQAKHKFDTAVNATYDKLTGNSSDPGFWLEKIWKTIEQIAFNVQR